jgi:hypothetical protein
VISGVCFQSTVRNGVLNPASARCKANLVYHRTTLTHINLFRFIGFLFVRKNGLMPAAQPWLKPAPRRTLAAQALWGEKQL